jgi:hypothetical protein
MIEIVERRILCIFKTLQMNERKAVMPSAGQRCQQYKSSERQSRIVVETDDDDATFHPKRRERNSRDMFQGCRCRREPIQGMFVPIMSFVVGILTVPIS